MLFTFSANSRCLNYLCNNSLTLLLLDLFSPQFQVFRMADSLYYTSSPLLSSVSSVPVDSGLESNNTTCQDWEQAHHLLFHLANLSLGLGFIIPTTIGLHMIFLRLLLMTGIQHPLWLNYCVIAEMFWVTIISHIIVTL